MGTKFQISAGGIDLVVVQAEAAFDAKRYAAGKFGRDDLACEPVKDSAVESVQMEWRGSDAGPRPDRAQWIRTRPTGSKREKDWGAWKRT